MIYCIIPGELARRLHEPLRRHFSDRPDIEVVVERRAQDRREDEDRRSSVVEVAGERRKIRNAEGRRVADRRGALVPIDPLELPRKVRPHAQRLVFLERLKPTGQAEEDLDTARLVTRIQGGDQEAFGDLYVRFFDRVYNYLRVVLNDRHEAEDATQQVFMDVLEALPRYERRRQPFRAWLFVVVRNYAIHHVQRMRRVQVVAPAEIDRRREPESIDDIDLGALDWISDQDLLLFIERLPLPQRQVLLLRYMLDLSNVQVAAILGRSSEDVRALQHRAQKFLRDRLTAIGRKPTVRGQPPMRRAAKQATVLRMRRFALFG